MTFATTSAPRCGKAPISGFPWERYVAVHCDSTRAIAVEPVLAWCDCSYRSPEERMRETSAPRRATLADRASGGPPAPGPETQCDRSLPGGRSVSVKSPTRRPRADEQRRRTPIPERWRSRQPGASSGPSREAWPGYRRRSTSPPPRERSPSVGETRTRRSTLARPRSNTTLRRRLPSTTREAARPRSRPDAHDLIEQAIELLAVPSDADIERRSKHRCRALELSDLGVAEQPAFDP